MRHHSLLPSLQAEAARADESGVQHQWPHAHGRRRLLGGGAATALAFLSGARHRAWAEQPGDDEFLQLSKLLTGRADLNAETSRRLNAALTAAHQDFPAQVSACASFARAHGFATVEPLAAVLDVQNPQLAAVLHIIVSAWYVGVAGDGPQAKVIAWREALMFDAVGAVLPTPSYCRAAPDYWTAKPPTT